MKNFVKHTFTFAICAAALLSSCIKEEAYVMEEVAFDVTLTRAGADSEQQGDQIKDIMLWAFEVDSRGTVKYADQPALGWRQYTPPTDTYTSLNLHLPVKICGATSSSYRIIALLNRETFTDADGKALTLGRNSTYNDIAAAMFVSSSLMSQAPAEGTPGTPAVMPITHWRNVTVPNTGHGVNADGTFTCPKVTIPVYRTVAKTQFFMACKGTQTFGVSVKSLKLYCGDMPDNGAVLSSLSSTELNSPTNEPEWFKTPTMSGAEDVYEISGAAGKTLTKSIESASDNISDYDLIGSHFIYETQNVSNTPLAATTKPTNDLGYYYEIVYEADGQEHTYYTGIPYSILRNHDYQVRALVEGGSGELSFEVVVNEWAVEEEIIDYTNIVTVTEGGPMKWTQLPDAKQVPSGYTQNTDGYILDSEGKTVGVVPVTTDNNGVINMTEYGDAYATCTFALSTPVGGTWYAVLETVSGDVDAFEIVEANSGAADNVVADGLKTTHTGNSASGPISPVDVATGNTVTGLVTLKFKTKADNETLTPNQAVLKITAKGFWGGNERVYEVVNLTGLTDANGKDVNYSLRQPVKAL